MMFDLEHEGLYDLMIAMFELLPLFEMNDMIGSHMLGFSFNVYMGLALFCLMDRYVYV